MSAPAVSVVIRARDEESGIGRTLELLAGQTVSHETIVVDSGSRDATVAIARAAGAEVIEIAPEEFTYGHALNVGCEAAAAPVIVALSAHAFPPDERWLERMLSAFDDERVCCACGYERGPDGEPLSGPSRQDLDAARADPRHGYTNSAGGFRVDLWRARPFRADMPGTEDREWAWHWLQQGRVVAIDPALVVEHDHSRDPLRAVYRRAHREAVGYAMFLDQPPPTLGETIRTWWVDQGWHRSRLRARLDPYRIARLAGEYRGRR
jgi:rhamnosyltransferase